MYQGPGDRYPPRIASPPPLPRMQGGFAVDPFGGFTSAPQLAPEETFTVAANPTPYCAYSAWRGGGRIRSGDGGAAAPAGAGATGGAAGAEGTSATFAPDASGSACATPAHIRSAATDIGRAGDRRA